VSAEIIAIGSELTCGARLDTNSQWLSRQLESLGWTVQRHTTLSDSLDVLAAEIAAASERAQVVIITGGLGPTLDDITRDAMAVAFEQPLVRDEESLSQIEAIFAARGRSMPERNHRQAERPRDAAAIPNSCGTAPGILLRHRQTSDQDHPHECVLAALPGVPFEMKRMFLDHVQPAITGSGTVVERVQVRTFGLGESDVEQRLGDLTARGRNPEVGITASEAVISLSITARGCSSEQCSEMIAPIQQQILERLGTAVFATGEQDLHQFVTAELERFGNRVACVEGGSTGGLVAHWLCDHPQYERFLMDARLRCIAPEGQFTTGTSEPRENWERHFRSEVASIRESTGADFVLLTSNQWDSTSDRGVRVRHGYVAVAGPQSFEMCDVSMSGNLAIFRSRAARTALNILRLTAFRR